MSRKLNALAIALTTMLVSACSSVGLGETETPDFCLIYEPITLSAKDTPETMTQVLRNNVAWEALCE